MTEARNWRDASRYARAEDYPPPALAWEFLRRNADYARTIKVAKGATADRAAGRWGLRFRDRPAPGRRNG